MDKETSRKRIEYFKNQFKPTKWSIRSLKKELATMPGFLAKLSFINDLIDVLSKDKKSKELDRFIRKATILKNELEFGRSKIKINDLDAFLEKMYLLKKEGIIDVSYNVLGKHIFTNFETEYKASTLTRKLKDFN